MPAISTDPAVALALWIQLQDSAFPAGRMVHSHGLEEWLSQHPDAEPDEVAAVTLDYLSAGVAPLDATITAAAWVVAPDHHWLRELDELAASYKLFDNARTASESSGRQLAAAAGTIGLAAESAYLQAVRAGITEGHSAVVDGALQAALGIPQHTAVLGSLRSMLASLLSAAVRLGRLGPLQSQRLQAGAAADLVDMAEQACRRDLDDLWSTAPALEISGMRHETRTGRLFAT
ncbi:urease accessory protein UreF [Mycobacterium sp. SMC-4]|uniref:urease accessory protein UreF n=1 Tax=Mycobacterium sp. SMC-4 TaxID=2857059 RepID=UPI0021B2ED75|nr:urease accessory UreF family protein [Mycobacterium sp. SMC-4]UXA17375.1 urease accessory protein UreF [Mycobacterium sp. SMC-4]